jgi:hypothetical protein
MRSSQRDLRICVVTSVLLLGCGAASTQPAPSAPPFQARVEELARALQSDPRLKGLSEQQRIDRVEFVVGNTLFVLLHEMGHVLIADMKLPVLGREEDAADTFAALAMLKIGTSFSQRVLAADVTVGQKAHGVGREEARGPRTDRKTPVELLLRRLHKIAPV